MSRNENHKLVISEPLKFYCQFDEDCFYHWLKSLDSLQELEILPGNPLNGISNKILLSFHQEGIDDEDLKQLIGLLMRYQLDMSSLISLCTKSNEKWFKNPKAYWYCQVFGA